MEDMNKKEKNLKIKEATNPFLPCNEFVPDPEPYLFDGRVYVYGSHDRFDAPIFCRNDYVGWSAAKEDLANWKYEGIIYRRKQDPLNRLGLQLLFAPDIVKGKDNYYYLYYGLGFTGLMGVAKGKQPYGPFEFYGHVRYKDGTLFGRKKHDFMPFDPAVLLDTDGRIYLFSGFAKEVPSIATGFCKLRN